MEFQPGPRTGSDRDGSVEDASNLCDKPADNTVTICVNKNDIMDSGSDDRDSDIANMSDFSDEEDGVQEESRPDVFRTVHLKRLCIGVIDRPII